mgnify:FL=1
MSTNVSLEKFYDFKVNHCDKFFPKNVDIWSTRILFECMDDEELLDELKEYIDISSDISAEELDKIMQKLRDRTNEYIRKCEGKEKDELFNNFSRAIVYFGLLESLDELASFATNLLAEIRKKYGERYLDVIAKYDKGNLSLDTAKIMNNTKFDDIDYNDELLKKYAILKKWQDKQHEYYQTIIEPLLMKLDDMYRENHQLPFNVEFDDVFAYKRFYELCNKKIISIDELAKLRLCGIDKEIIKLVGGKSYGLAALKSNNIPIPESKVIPTTTDISNELLDELNRNIRYSVRSSADIEDGNKNSFAGMFDSYLDVPYASLKENILKVIQSKNNERLQKYISTNHLEQPNIAVVIQSFIEPEYAGVWIGKDENSGYLEYVKGNGERLVSGRENPKREIWENKECSGDALECEDGIIGELLIKYQNKVVPKKNEVADFEWMILKGHLIMLQYRPVTSKIDIKQQISDNEDVIKGIPSSPGRVTGSCRFINARYIDQVNDWHEGDILLSWYTDPEWMHILSKSSGIVTAVGGFLCHASIIARELGIPCVVGIGPNNMKKIWNENYLTVDGDKGTVEVVKEKELK